MNTLSNFESWFASEVQNGLVDIKLAVVPGKHISSEAVEREILASELAVANNQLRGEPTAKSAIPENIIVLMNKTSVPAAAQTV